ncbi:MAG: PAS domain S-box protein, partial [Nitrospirota bacterium]|nr:PAS domain S-box protein [Nitrospirota bacterium]MDX2420075.1 PAS domain S-box protein [Nitrospirota bacterium]
MNPTSILRVFGKSTLGRRFTFITILFLTVLLGIMVYTTMTIQKEKSNAILIDMAGRQRMLFEKHLNEVYLTSQGITADYKSTRELLRSTLDSLMKGGPVTLDPETGKSQTIPAVPTEEILLKLQEQVNHFDKVIESSNGLLMLSPDFPEFYRTLKTLRAQNSIVIGIADDAVKQLAKHSELNIATMVKWESIAAFFVALLGVFITSQGIRASKKLENEIAERKRAESALLEANQLMALDAELGNIINKNLEFQDLLQVCSETLVQRLDAAFVRIWILNPDTQVLELQASAGLYTHLNGPHGQIPVGQLKIGQIAAEKKPHLTNAVIGDPRIPEQGWAKQEGLVAFAGYPLIKNHEVLGVMGLFAKHRLTEMTLESLQIVADRLSMAIERQQALYEYQKLARHNEQILASAGEGIYGLDLEGQTTFVNPAGAKLLGYTPQELIGLSMHTVVHHTKTDGSPYPQKECPMYAAFTEGTIHKVEDEVLWRKNGTSFPVEYSSMPIWQDGNLAGAVVTFRDVTERKQAEKKFKESEQKFRVMAETVPDILFTNQPDGSCDFVNQRLYEYTGLPSDSGLGFGWSKALHSDDLEHSKNKWLRTVNAGLPYEDRYRLISPNGTYRWFMARAIPVKNAEGRIEKWFGVSTDIHDLVQRDEALRQSEERLSYALEATREGVWDWDMKTDRVLFSKRWCENLGFAPEEVEPHVNSWKTLVNPEDLPMIMEKLEAHLEGQTPVYTSEYRLFTKSGMWRWNLAVGKVVSHDQDGKPLRMVGVDVDITEQKKRQALLETMQQTQSQFILANDPAETFNSLLENFLSLTGSAYGFIGEILFTTEGKPYLQTQAITNIAWNQETRELYERFAPNLEFFNLNTLFGKVITTGQPVLANDPMNDPRSGGLPKGHPPMHAFLGLPFYRGDRLVGMVGLANRANGYDAGLIPYLQPLLSSCGIIIEAHQNSQQKIQAEKDLRATEQMYRQILDSIPDMVLVKDQNFRILWANKAFRSYYHMTNEELKGILDAPINKADFTKQYNKDDSYVINTGKILDIPEEPVTRHDGQVGLFHTIKAPLFGESGEVVKSVGVSRDITERKQAEALIRKGERKFRAIYEQAPTGIGTMNSLSGQFTEINQKFCAITGYSKEEMLERNFQDITHPDDLQADLDQMQKLLAGQINSFHMEKRYFRKDGEVIWVNLTCVPLWLEPTDPRLHLAMVEDITHRKHAEKVLQESEERYRTLYEDNPSMYFTVAQDGKILSVNQFGAQQLGYAVEELI